MNQQKSLTRNRPVNTVSNLAESYFGDLSASALSVSTTAPVGHTVRTANGVGSEAADGAVDGSSCDWTAGAVDSGIGEREPK